ALDGVTDADEDAWHLNSFDSRLLRAGANVLAVEIHQNQPNSSDISFDLELVGLPAAALPRLTAGAEGSRLTLQWPAWAGEFMLQHSGALSPAGGWSQVSASVLGSNGFAQATLTIAPSTRFFRLTRPQ
ncbi:MAG TPA: hypothetical protein VFB63_08920, partial [Bryobacteraceae bacterium]|nr:hypothetical protein [Bryobacteraceae bacterium]